ncbi:MULTISPECIES: hypothetical protein [Streptomyces]|uniref:C2H2-type domain-containing protein n=1 Tax=Streptomyces griseiscabiei TaxID=2993540 RepID=A0ABU4LE36_9ACTN|nr:MULTISPECIES: hypothetical protein [Streptomyces]MBZ3908345.1 hypothetical protein [Streptomyces griseiscabiei]MDX2913858.1 hypothetical protein [Streptomyces griseiscabiei]
MPFTYNCPRCGTASRPYTFRAGADNHGAHHRRRHHDGDYPVGESIQRIARTNPLDRATAWRPSRGDAVAAAVVGLLVLWSIWHPFTN